MKAFLEWLVIILAVIGFGTVWRVTGWFFDGIIDPLVEARDRRKRFEKANRYYNEVK